MLCVLSLHFAATLAIWYWLWPDPKLSPCVVGWNIDSYSPAQAILLTTWLVFGPMPFVIWAPSIMCCLSIIIDLAISV